MAARARAGGSGSCEKEAATSDILDYDGRMTVAVLKPMTQAEFFPWAQAREERYEFDGLQPVAMTGGSANHNRLVVNIALELRRRLGEGGPCEAFASNAGLQTLGTAVRYPDAVVGCHPFDGRDDLVPDPVIVFEVASPCSTREDRILEPQDYAAVPSIRRYVIVEQAVIGLTVLWREAAPNWQFLSLTAGDVLHLPEIGIEIPVDGLYARVTFE